MGQVRADDAVSETIARAAALATAGDAHAAIDVLTRANRVQRDPELERALVGVRRAGAQGVALRADGDRRPPLIAEAGDGTIAEVPAGDLSIEAIRSGFSACGCLLVRGLVSPDRATQLAAGLDAALAAYDASLEGRPVDPGWYDPGPMPDRVSPGLPEDVHRSFLRSRGSLWTVDSPRMLFDLFELIDETGLGTLMTELLGERPLLSAIKATLRRMPPDVEVEGRWHQDGAFLGEQVAAFNCWLALSPCGVDAPGLDVVPRRLAGVVPNDGARYDWAASDDAVAAAADGVPIVRPVFGPGDALLFDHLLLHRTGASPGMTRERHAIESWFFPPGSYPVGQLPVLF